MLTRRVLAVLAFAFAFAAASSSLAAARAADDALSLVPADAASVAVIRFNELRSSPLAGRLFSDADHIHGDGEAARFLEESNLKPREDVDTVVLVGLVPSGSDTPALALFEGRFDPERLGAAARSRGATKVSDYYRVPEKGSARHGGPQAVAFVSPRLIVAGSESAVVAALAARGAGGTTFSAGAGLGRQLSRIDRSASMWALVDVTRYPAIQKGLGRSGAAHSGGSEAAGALLGAMKSVTLFSFQATVHADDLAVTASGVSPDAETRQLLEDSLRGVIAMWRLAASEKSPEIVAVLRKFKIESDQDTVTVRGTLPGSVVRSLADKRSASR
ncbi:MAG TPA: hypothetical protein VOA00_01960 [Thermoanaerobaculia bacterium]|nr:hypothetical protein [Thermoanaerobaculia bacterium]